MLAVTIERCVLLHQHSGRRGAWSGRFRCETLAGFARTSVPSISTSPTCHIRRTPARRSVLRVGFSLSSAPSLRHCSWSMTAPCGRPASICRCLPESARLSASSVRLSRTRPHRHSRRDGRRCFHHRDFTAFHLGLLRHFILWSRRLLFLTRRVLLLRQSRCFRRRARHV